MPVRTLMPQPPTQVTSPRQREVRRRIDAAGVERGRALAGLELVQRDQVVLVAVAAARDRAVIQRQRLADDQARIDLRRRGSRRPSSGSRPASPRAFASQLLQQLCDSRPRRITKRELRRIVEVDLRDRGQVRLVRCRRAAKYGDCAVAASELVAVRAVRRRAACRRGARSSPCWRRRPGSAGSSPDPSASARPARSARPPVPAAPTQSWIQRVMMLAHAPGVGQPAVVAAADLHDDRRLRRVVAIDDADGLLIRGVHVVGARELRRLAAGVVAVAAAVRAADVLPEVDAERLDVGRRGRRARSRSGRPSGRSSPDSRSSRHRRRNRRARSRRAAASRSESCNAVVEDALHGSLSPQLPAQYAAVSANTRFRLPPLLKLAGAVRDLRAIGVVARRAEAHRAEHFLHLALRERVAVGQLLAERLRAVAAAPAVRPAQPSSVFCARQAPAVVPVVVRRDVARLEVVGVDQVLRLHLALRVDQRGSASRRSRSTRTPAPSGPCRCGSRCSC